MNKLSIALITAATSVAFAQAPAAPAKTAPAAPAKAAPAAPVKAEPMKEKAAMPAKDAKAAPAKMEPPKAPTEIADFAKTMVGTWKCTGTMADMADMTKTKPMKLSMTAKLDLDKWWINVALTGTFKGQMYVTYDTASKKWYRTMVDSWGGSETSWSTGMANNKLVWEGEGRGMGMTMKMRTTEETMSPKNMKMTGEMSMDNGKKWMKGWEADCKK